jgi:type I restriction enzyme, S subunit
LAEVQGAPVLAEKGEGGPVPVDWAEVQLGDVADFINGYAFKPSQWSESGRPIIRIQNLTGTSDKINYFAGELPERYLVRDGDVLISWSASLGAFIWAGGEAWVNQHIFKISDIKENVDKHFLLFVLQASIEEIKGKTRGSTMKHVTRKEFLSTHIPLPPYNEQQAIADVLRTVQKAIAVTEQIIEATRELKRSLMNHLFTYGPVPVHEAERVPLKETEIGPVPVHWEVAKVGEVASVGNGSTPKRTNAAYWKGGTLPWLTSGKVHETIIEQADEFVTELAQEECHLPLVPRGSVVVAITGQGKTLGNAAMVMFDAFVSQHLAYLRFQTSHVAPEFVLAFLQQRYEDLRRASRAGGSTKGALTCGFLKSYSIPLPPLEEQQEIAHQLSVVSGKIAAEENRKRTLEVLFKTLLHNLMTAKVMVTDLDLSKAGELV